ncbi:MAG: TonB-dependent receptor [Saprospiraceae bacterium]
MGQNSAKIFGTIKDLESNKPIEVATVFVRALNISTETDAQGKYSIQVPSGNEILLEVSRLGYKTANFKLTRVIPEAEIVIDFDLTLESSNLEVIIRENAVRSGGMIRENIDNLKLIPSTTGNFETILPHIALGTNSGTGGELSSQYQVRGGNYDENLVYVNDFEIYRPQLVRSGQQEGLTFPNPDLIRDLSFSSGGFQAKYGDKQSSVLDIKYKRPETIRGSVSMSLLGATSHLEGSKNIGMGGYRKFTYLLGARYKTTRYLLNSLQLKGEYLPDFADVQGYFTYDLNKNWQIGLMGNYNSSIFRFVPESRSTATGLIDFTLRLSADINGNEVDNFKTGMVGASLTYLPERKKNPLFVKFMGSAFQSLEQESFDVISDYRLSLIDAGFGSANAGKELVVLGDGVQQTYARNLLWLRVKALDVKGGYEFHPHGQSDHTHFIQWGVRARQEDILDRINDWERLDSALYSIPHDEQLLAFKRVLKTKNELSSTRFAAYFQDEYTIQKSNAGETRLSGGVRLGYWSLDKELFVNPRAQVMFKPGNWDKNISFRLAAGLYYQPPFYRELRSPEGIVNPDLLSQKSMHVVGGFTWDFQNKNKTIPYRLVTELYFKKLWDQVIYDIDNVRIQYSGQNDSKGYITGIDMRLNGEFVKGAESWFNISFLRARESINGLQHQRREKGHAEGVNVSDVPKPTDQFLTFSTFFQDYLPNNENLKVNVSLTLGTGQPFGIPENNRVYRNTYRYPAYHRVDLGFSYLVWDQKWKSSHPKHLLKFAESSWLSLEVYNLLKVSNVASNTWFKSIYGVQYAIPNYLTSRRINLKYKITFH